MAGLSILATPIGNLDDITLRGIETLKAADVVACEDTRRTLKLLSALGIKKPLVSCRSENEATVAKRICAMIEEGKEVVYASDAGTPALSDPGALLVREVRAAGLPVRPIPGVSAFAAIVSVAGVRDKAITFEGFLSPKPGKRRKRLRELLEREEAFVVYESPFRILKLLTDLADLSPDRTIVIGREMTKVYEEFLTDTPAGHLENLQERSKIVGEFTVLVSGNKMA